MSLNTMAYSEIDTIDVKRSTWHRHFGHKTTFNAGKLVPILFDEDIIPGTTIKHKTSCVIRMQTPIYPTMDNLQCDIFYFRAPKFWYWEHFKNQMGQNDLGAWTENAIEYTTPEVKVTEPYGVNDLASYMGVPINVSGFGFDRLGIGFYCDIWNNYFRAQALQAPIIIDKTDSDLESDDTINTGYGLLPVCRNFDLFSGMLPEPQKGSAVELPLGESAPVSIYGNGMSLGLTNGNKNGTMFGHQSQIGIIGYSSGFGKPIGTAESGTVLDGSNSLGVTTDPTKSGLIGLTDLTGATAATINALYMANAIQRILQADARLGTVYKQILLQYGVHASSEETLVPEFLGSISFPVNIETVLKQSETTSESPLGFTGAFSVSANVHEDFTKSFTTHDMLIGLCCVRVNQHTYQQGLEKQFKRQRRYDHYNPHLAHIANQPVYNYQWYLQSDEVLAENGEIVNNQVAGFVEAWQEYLYKTSRISGELLSTYELSLDEWHYGDYYASLPVLDDEWIVEPLENIDRTLAVQSSEAHQFIADFWFEQTVSAPIPLNRIPGLGMIL